MDFNKDIKNTNINKLSFPKQKKEKEFNPVQNDTIAETKETPNNPSYWQNTVGIKKKSQSFKGYLPEAESINESELGKEKDFLIKQFKAANYNNEEQIRECLEMVNQLAKYGEKAVKSYIEIMRKAFFQNHCNTKYIKSCNKIFNIKPLIDFEYINPLDSFLAKLDTVSDEELGKVNYFLTKVLNDKNTDDETQLAWICYCMPKQLSNANTSEKFEEQYKEKYTDYADYIKHFSGPFEKKLAINLDFPKAEMKKTTELLDKGAVKPRAICNLMHNTFGSVRLIDYIPKINCYNIINDIYDNEEKCKLFNTVMLPKMSRFDAELIRKLFKYPARFSNTLIGSFKKKEDRGEEIFSDPEQFIQMLKSVDAKNYADFLSFTKHLTTRNSIVSGCKYVNSYDRKFNSNVYKQAEYIHNKLFTNEFNEIEIAQACINEETGEISPYANELLDFIYIDSKSIKNKILKTTGKIFSRPKTIMALRQEIDEYCVLNILNSTKNKNGNIDKTNLYYIKKLLSIPSDTLLYWNLPELMETLKDENGIIDKNKFSLAYRIAKKENSYDKAQTVMKTLNKFPESKHNFIFETIMNSNLNHQYAMRDFGPITKFCFNEKGNLIKENFDFVKKLSSNADLINNCGSIFEMCSESEDNKMFILDFIRKSKGKYSIDFDFIDDIYQTFKTKDKKLPEDIKEKMYLFVRNGILLNKFKNAYSSAIKQNNVTGEFYHDDNLFNKIIEFMTVGLNEEDEPGDDISAKRYVEIIENSLDIKSLNFKEKVEILEVLKRLSDYYTNIGNTKYEYLRKMIDDVNNSLSITKTFIPINEADKTDFISNVLSADKTNLKTPFEKVLIKSIPFLETMKNGLNLTYSRKDFLDDLSLICQKDENALKIIETKTGMHPIVEKEGSSIKITGYNGIIYLDELDKNNETEKLIYDCIHHFMYENDVNTGNKELDTQLKYIIKAFPEFINTIGKKQHPTHDYTLDIHQLLVLAYAIENPVYTEKLGPKDRAILKMSALFHDLMKQENMVDDGHQYASSIYAKAIVEKVIQNPENKDRLYELINNHHWLSEYSNAENKIEKSKELAFKFRRPNDFELAKIMAEADLKAVSKNFYDNHKSTLGNSNLEYIQKNLNFIYTTGNALFSDYIVQPSKLENHIERINDRDYKVINFHKIPREADMGEYGFYNGTTKSDIRFLVHMADELSLYNGLNTVKMLTSPINGGVLSESLISVDHNRTYCNRRYGVVLSQENTNIINESKDNQSSGNEKDIKNVIELLFKSPYDRVNFKRELLSLLDIELNTISNEDYGNFYKEVLASKTSLKQIAPDKIFKLGRYNITGKQLIEKIKKYQDSLIDMANIKHNEIVGYIPKISAVIAKENSLEKIPQEVLDFAYENEYPIILI